jgi:hypothetical protein
MTLALSIALQVNAKCAIASDVTLLYCIRVLDVAAGIAAGIATGSLLLLLTWRARLHVLHLIYVQTACFGDGVGAACIRRLPFKNTKTRTILSNQQYM